MKTKELIAALQREDPTGETEVVVDNIPIHFVEKLPSYYDGCMQVLVYDEKFRIVGAKVVGRGDIDKINIHTLSIESVIFDNVDLPVDLSDLNGGEFRLLRWSEIINTARKEAKEIDDQLDVKFK